MEAVPINYWAVLACGVVSLALGFLWFGPLFGKTWMRLSGMDPADTDRMRSNPKMRAKMYQGYAIAFVASLVMAFVIAHAIIFAAAYMHMSGMTIGLITGFMSWIGFVVPPTLSMVLWERKPWSLWVLINAYWLLQLLIFGAILAQWV